MSSTLLALKTVHMWQNFDKSKEEILLLTVEGFHQNAERWKTIKEFI